MWNKVEDTLPYDQAICLVKIHPDCIYEFPFGYTISQFDEHLKLWSSDGFEPIVIPVSEWILLSDVHLSIEFLIKAKFF